MKKLMTLMLGMALTFGTVAAFAHPQEPKKEEDTTKKKKKGGKKAPKKDETKKDGSH